MPIIWVIQDHIWLVVHVKQCAAVSKLKAREWRREQVGVAWGAWLAWGRCACFALLAPILPLRRHRSCAVTVPLQPEAEAANTFPFPWDSQSCKPAPSQWYSRFCFKCCAVTVFKFQFQEQRKKMNSNLLLVFLLVVPTAFARTPRNCGLACHSVKKCMVSGYQSPWAVSLKKHIKTTNKYFSCAGCSWWIWWEQARTGGIQLVVEFKKKEKKKLLTKSFSFLLY